VQPSIGLYFTDKPATKFPVLLELQNDKHLISRQAMRIFKDRRVYDAGRCGFACDLSYAHYLGKDLLATATRPTGRSKPDSFPRWDFNWQAVSLRGAGLSAKGHDVECGTSTTTARPTSPIHFAPPQRVQGGNRTTDEMEHLWLQVLRARGVEKDGDARKS